MTKPEPIKDELLDERRGLINKSARASGAILLVILLLCAWYSVAANYDYGAVSGTYTFRQNGETSTLVLKPDRSFQQELTRLGKVERAEGSWHRSGQAGIEFSKEFLTVSGQELDPEGTAFGHLYKSLGLFFSITLNPDPGGPTFRKKLFS